MELAQRIIDFTSGACYSLGGSLQKVSSYIFVLGPYNVDITGDLQNILGGSAPSVRAGIDPGWKKTNFFLRESGNWQISPGREISLHFRIFLI